MPYQIGYLRSPDALIISAAAQRLAYWDLKPGQTGSAVSALLNRDLADLGRPDLIWRPLTPDALSIDPIWGLLSGEKDEDSPASDTDGVYENLNAAVFAVRNGDTLLISFRGSNGSLLDGKAIDFLDAASNIDGYLQKLNVFLDALKSYLGRAEGSDIAKIIVTGHSLGAGAATAFANGVASSSTRLSDLLSAANSNPHRIPLAPLDMSDVDIILYASPGVPRSGSYGAASPRIIEIQLTDDPVANGVFTGSHEHPAAALLQVTYLNYVDGGIPGVVVARFDASYTFEEHKQDLYFNVVEDLNTAAFTSLIDPATPIYALSAAGAPLTAAQLAAAQLAGAQVVNESGKDDTRNIVDWSITAGASRVILGLSGDDRIFGNSGTNYISGGTGADELTGNTSTDFLDGAGGSDYLRGGAGDDFLWGGFGNDVYSVGPGEGADIVSDVAGLDTLRYFFGPSLVSIDANRDHSTAGQSIITARGAGGAIIGSLKLIAGDSNFSLIVIGRDAGGAETGRITIQGMTANPVETLEIVGNASTDTVLNGSIQLINEWTFIRQVAAPPPLPPAPPQPPPPGSPSSTEIVLTNANDTWNGLTVSETVWALGGSDSVSTGDGNDTVWGGDGSDNLNGGGGSDVLIGDDSAAQAGNDNLVGGDGNDLLSGEAGDDTLDGGGQ